MMKCRAFYNEKIPGIFFAGLAGFLVLLILAACAAGNYGTLEWDRELDNTFVNYQVLPDHRYYITLP